MGKCISIYHNDRQRSKFFAAELEEKGMKTERLPYEEPLIRLFEIVSENFLLTSVEDENEGEWDVVDDLMSDLLTDERGRFLS